MKKINKFSIIAFFLILGTSCTTTIEKDKYVDESGNSEEQTISVKTNLDIPNDGIYKVYKYVEDNVSYILNDTSVGKAITAAYQVLKDGTKKAIENINGFLLDKNIAHVELELEPGVPVEGLKLSGRTYRAIYLKNKINTKLDYTVLPADASNKSVKFFTSDKSVLSVDGRGNITIHKPGTATVTVITLEGGFKEMCLFKIEDGTTKLKDSFEFADYSSNALEGNRYDDESKQESQFNAVEVVPFSDEILAVGTRKLKNNANASIISYGKPDKTFMTIELDPEDKLFSETLVSLTYNDDDQGIYTVGYGLDQRNSKQAGIIAKFKFVNGEFNKEIEAVGTPKLFSTTSFDTQFTSIISIDNRLYVSAIEYNDPGLGFKTDKHRQAKTYIYIFDSNLNLIERIQIDEANRISKLGYNEEMDVIYFAGEGVKEGVGIMGDFAYNGDKTIRTGSTSATDDIKFNDIVPIGTQTYVVVGETRVSSKRQIMISRFSLSSNNDKFTSNMTNFNLHDSRYKKAALNSLIYKDGIISVFGYAEVDEEVGENWYSIKKETVNFMYGLVINFDLDFNYVSGFKYFNGKVSVGCRQAFTDAVLTNGGTITAVGYSNYGAKNNEPVWHGYIQRNVSLLGIEINADYPEFD